MNLRKEVELLRSIVRRYVEDEEFTDDERAAFERALNEDQG